VKIAWVYLDKRSATVNALKDYIIMDFIIQNHTDDVMESHARMTAIHSATFTEVPHHPDPLASDMYLASAIDEIDVLQERYRSALEYMEWFRPAWEALTDDERFVLGEFYRGTDDGQVDAIENIRNRFHIERSSAYRKKERALTRLATLLYGK